MAGDGHTAFSPVLAHVAPKPKTQVLVLKWLYSITYPHGNLKLKRIVPQQEGVGISAHLLACFTIG